MVHAIRLRGPWVLRHPLLPAPVRFKSPGLVPVESIPNASDAREDLPAKIDLVRNFNRPTGLDENSVVALCGSLKAESVSVSLNQSRLAEVRRKTDQDEVVEFQLDVTSMLQNSNEITLSCQPTTDDLAIVEVWLEIE